MQRPRPQYLLPAAALLLALLLLPACDNQSQEEIAQLRASLQSWQSKCQTLSNDKAQADQRAAQQQTHADALAGERDDLKARLAAAAGHVKQLEAQVKELKKTPPPPPPSKSAAPLPTDLTRVLARLKGVGADLYRTGDYNAVNAVLQSACDLGAKDPLTYYRLGYAASSAGKYADALTWYRKALDALDGQSNPDPLLQAQCLNNCGVALSKTGKAPDAIAAYTQALDIAPHYTPTLYNLALIYADNAADQKKAVDVLRRYIANGGARSVSARSMLKKLLPAGRQSATAPSPPAKPAAPAR